MSTLQLYYTNQEDSEFEAQVISSIQVDDKYHTILDQTLFYPEAGGMKNDVGTLNNITIEHVIKDNDNNIIHISSEAINSEKVHGKIDYQNRFKNNQSHSAQHLLSALFINEYQIDTLSHHDHEYYCDIDLDVKNLTNEQIIKIEKLANEAIMNNYKLETFNIKRDELAKYNLQDNPKYVEPIRIVWIKELNDYNPCGCLHVETLGKLQAIKIFKHESNSRGTRIFFSVGQSLLDYFNLQYQTLDKLNNLTKSNIDNIEHNVQSLLDKKHILEQEKVALLEKYYNDLIDRSFDHLVIYDNNLSFNELKVIENLVVNSSNNLVCLLQIKNKDMYQFILCKNNENPLDLNNLFNSIKSNTEIRGGGKNNSKNGSSTTNLISLFNNLIEVN